MPFKPNFTVTGSVHGGAVLRRDEIHLRRRPARRRRSCANAAVQRRDTRDTKASNTRFMEHLSVGLDEIL